MADGVYYAMTYASGGAGLQATSWNSVDLTTGEFTKIADATDGMPTPYVDLPGCWMGAMA